MVTAAIVLVWMSIGLGVVIAYCDNSEEKLPDASLIIFASAVWPAFVSAAIYRAIATSNDKDHRP